MLTEIKIAPRGNRVGLASASLGRHISLHVVVLPKHWREGASTKYRLEGSVGGQILVTAYEGDSLVFEGGGPLDEVVDELLRVHERSGLFELRFTRDLPALAAPTDMSAALDLFALLNETIGITPTEQVPLTEANGISEMFARRHLVDLVSGKTRKIHQGYVETNEEIAPLRGRIDSAGLSLALARRRARVLCHFDELTPGVPLFRILATALEVSSMNTGGLSAILDCALGGVRKKALRLRRQFQDVQAYSITEALRVANQIKPASLMIYWREAFHAAVRVLEFGQQSLGGGSFEVNFDQLLVRTDELWENLMVKASEVKWGPRAVFHSKPGKLADGLYVPAPWKVSTNGNSHGPGRQNGFRVPDSYPDLVVSLGDKLWCADAKYKTLGTEPERADQYQIFAYSHLTSIESAAIKVTACALLYPATDDQGLGVRMRLTRQPAQGPHLPLEVIALPWPSRTDLHLGLDMYAERISHYLPDLV